MNRRLLINILSLIGIASVVLVVLTLLGPSLGRQVDVERLFGDYQRDFDAARARWLEQPISEYHLLIVRISPYNYSCRQDVTVKQEKVAAITDTCQGYYSQLYHQIEAGIEPSETVTEFFEQIEYDISNRVWMDECTLLALDITYNRDRGYPERISYRWEQRVRASGQQVGVSGCRLMESNKGPEIRITLAPLELK